MENFVKSGPAVPEINRKKQTDTKDLKRTVNFTEILFICTDCKETKSL